MCYRNYRVAFIDTMTLPFSKGRSHDEIFMLVLEPGLRGSDRQARTFSRATLPSMFNQSRSEASSISSHSCLGSISWPKPLSTIDNGSSRVQRRMSRGNTSHGLKVRMAQPFPQRTRERGALIEWRPRVLRHVREGHVSRVESSR